MDRDLVPILAAYGACMLDAQILEGASALLMTLATRYQGAKFDAAPAEALSAKSAKKTLAVLFKAAKEREHFASAEEDVIWSAIRTRNDLAHSFLVDRAQQIATPSGRPRVLAELAETGTMLKAAGRIVDTLINKYLAAYGTSIAEVKRDLEKFWVSDEDADSNDVQ